MSGPDSSNGLEHSAWIRSVGVRDIFCLKTLALSQKRTSVRMSKMNAVARAQSTFRVLTVLQKYLYRQSQYSITWDSKCLAPIAQMVRTFGMNLKVAGFESPQVETFRVSKTLTFSQEYPIVCRKWMLLPAHSSLFKCQLYFFFKSTWLKL